MKRLFISSFLIILFSCNEIRQDRVQSFIPGVYVRDIKDEYTSGKDTLMISVRDPRINVYRIEKRTRYQQQADDKLLTPQYKVEHWTATYDRQHGQLHEQRKGKVLTFDPQQNRLSMGGSQYRKISE